MLRLAHFAAIGVLLIGAPVQAAQQVASTGPNNPNEIICKMLPPEIGSRLGGRRYCQTRRAWDDQRAQDRELLEDARRRGRLGPTGWW